MTQTALPYLFMRGGSSRGPYFNREDLPQDLETLSRVLVSVIGAGHPLNIDGIGGGNPVTTKVAMLSRSLDSWADIDYFFAQVSVESPLVDFKPTCGNILSAVGPAALEMGLIQAQGEETEIRIRAVNTQARVKARVQTPNRQVIYHGSQSLDGVPGTAAPIVLNFMDVVGSVCGTLLPSGNRRDRIDGVEVSCLDAAMPMVIARASDLGVSGYESSTELNDNPALFSRIERIRLQAAALMGMGDVSRSVTPKFGLLAPPQKGGTVAARYFMPWTAHPTMAVTGAQCLACCLMVDGTVADGLIERPTTSPTSILLEHPLGILEVVLEWRKSPQDDFILESAGLIRTARKISQGHLFIPDTL